MVESTSQQKPVKKSKFDKLQE
jgi:endonuclease V